MNVDNVKCPYCNAIIKLDIDWVIKNGRGFCTNCCKAFDLTVEEDDEK
jgi:endogenous inhibitor of DNA gyrase (YacG/DUF329 family)